MFPKLLQSPKRILGAACLLSMLLWLWLLWPQQAPLEVTFLDVGQGDCAVVVTPTRRVILIDGGGIPEGNGSHFDVGSKIILPYLHRSAIHGIDLMVLSHPHEDHLAGLLSVIDKMPVKCVMEPSIPHGSPMYRIFLETVKKKRIDHVSARRGMKIRVDRYTVMDVLNPAEEEVDALNANDASVAMLLRSRGLRVLFAGDCENSSEQAMCGSVADLEADVLKVGHHGSANASALGWLTRVDPQIAVISAGKNNLFGHPSPLTLRRLNMLGCRIYRTDLQGAIRITAHSNKISIRSFASGR